MVYELRCYTLAPGKMPEYLKAAETIGRPARGQNYGVNHGYWTAEFGALNQIWHLWKYDSYEERTRLRGELIVPTRPGWGADINEEAVRAHPPKNPHP